MSFLDKGIKSDYQIQLILVGQSVVGKTCILLRYADDTFTHVHMTTIGVESKSKQIEKDGESVTVQLWDTAGQER
jgi:Ras-related protein Rab-1A